MLLKIWQIICYTQIHNLLQFVKMVEYEWLNIVIFFTIHLNRLWIGCGNECVPWLFILLFYDFIFSNKKKEKWWLFVSNCELPNESKSSFQVLSLLSSSIRSSWFDRFKFLSPNDVGNSTEVGVNLWVLILSSKLVSLYDKLWQCKDYSNSTAIVGFYQKRKNSHCWVMMQ